jgi:pyridoxamine 5'-phosphate oxidase
MSTTTEPRRRPDPPGHLDDLDLTHAEAWGLLGRGVADRKCAFHSPAVATIGLDGHPRSRTVVLRAVDHPSRSLQFHTDRRSAKVAELQADPRASVLFYDAGWKVQIRIGGQATLHDEDLVGAEAWHRTRPMSRVCYTQSSAPGSIATEPAVAVLPDPRGDAFARENFVAVRITVLTLEWLYLAHAGHRRALFTYAPDKAVTSTWLAP